MNRRELEMALQDLFEGQLSGEAFDGLQDELRRNPEAREAYREYLLLEHTLKFRSKGVDMLRVVPMDRVNERRQRRTMKMAAFSAAAALALAAVVMTLILSRTPPPTVAFKTSPGTELLISHRLTDESPPEGHVMEPGSRLQLQRGTVELRFASGVRGIVRGPADLTLRREDLLDLGNGTVWCHVPSEAVGFQVITPELVLTDLGTEFGIISKPDLPDEVHVFTGKVEVLNLHGLRKMEALTSGHARKAGAAGRWNEIPVSRDPFLTELPANGRARVTLDDSATFTTSPGNEMIRKSLYRFAAAGELAGFDCGGSDKLVVTLSHERGSIRNVTYGGVSLVPAIQAPSVGEQGTSIFFLDSPASTGDLVVHFSSASNGVGGSLLALSNTAPGDPATTSSSKAGSAGLTTPVANCFLIASHACNSVHAGIRAAKAQAPLTPLFSGPTGSSVGGSGYRRVAKPGSVGATFSGSNEKPVTAIAAFSPIP